MSVSGAKSTHTVRLSESQRRTLVALRDTHGLDFRTIGRRYGVGETTASTLYRQIKAERSTQPGERA